MIVRLYGGPKHGEVLEVPDDHDAICFATPKIGWEESPATVVTVDERQYVADYPLTQNEDGETIFRFKN